MTARLTAAELDVIAGDWLAREDAAPLTPRERAELDAWLAAEDRRLGAYLRLRAASARLDRLAALKGGQVPTSEPAAPLAPERPSRRRLAIAAAIGAAAVLGAGLFAWQPGTYRTDVGEMRRVTLRDGSVMSLNTDTVIRVDYSGEARQVWLRRGEGHFIVAKDRTRPFIVHANGASVTAVGTAFTVRAEAKAPVRVTVAEGIVSIKPQGPQKAELVGAMHEAAIRRAAPEPQLAAVTPVEIERRLAWTEGRIILEGQTLGEAAAEFNRYNQRKLVVNPAAAGARVGGVFRTSEVEAFARTAAPSLGLALRMEPGGDIVMERAQPAG